MKQFRKKAVVARIIGILIGLAIVLLVNAFIAHLITVVLNTWTQLHPTFTTTFIVLIIVTACLGGSQSGRSR